MQTKTENKTGYRAPVEVLSLSPSSENNETKKSQAEKKSNNTEHKEHDIKHASEGILMLLLLLLYFVVFVNPLEQRILTFLLLRITLK